VSVCVAVCVSRIDKPVVAAGVANALRIFYTSINGKRPQNSPMSHEKRKG